MFSESNSTRRYLYIFLIFLVVFSLTAIVYIQRSLDHERKYFKTHAAILTNDIWAMNQNGAKAYLLLAVEASHYKSLSVSIPGTDAYIYVTSPPLTGLSHFLHEINLIGLLELQAEITHNNRVIGILNGAKYIRVIFPLINILIFLLLLSLTAVFIIHLFLNRKILRKQVEERTQNLFASEKRFHDLVNLLPEMVFETDHKGNVTYANKAAKELLQLPDTTDTAANFFDFILESERQVARRYFQKSMQDERSDLVEFTARDQRGRVFPILIRSAPINNNGYDCGARMIVIDISERRLLEAQLHRDQKMKAIGLMAGGVAHDLNNILSGIISYPELLLLDLDPGSSLCRPLEAIRQSGLDAAEVVSDLLTVARGIAANKEIIAPNELITDYLESTDFQQLLANHPLVRVDTALAPQLRNISCSPIHVRKCLMNLITNGVEAINGKGTLSITTENYDKIPPILKDEQNFPTGYFTKIGVHDNGSGISVQDLDHIFEPFYTKKVMGRSGTGLGLAVVWNTMSDHGGAVNVISNTQGTCFELFFPSVETELEPQPETLDWQQYKGNGETILVIDDELRQREIASKLLTTLNYSVQTAASGEEAIEYGRNHAADLMIIDMIMPPGLNGLKTFARILELHPQQKAIIASGYAGDEDVKAALALGAKEFIPKPYTLIQIAVVIHKVLHP